MGKLTQKVIALLNRRRGAQPLTLALEAEGLAISVTGDPASRRLLPWREIEKIVVFKRDLYTYDQISMAIEMATGGIIELSENMAGWGGLTRNLGRHLPSALPADEWFMKVVSPAFKPNPVEIYRRKRG